ncbi:MAG: EAL domain-containing protein [Gammaproteobacteria bacterium]|nr:EAL domain-containing protein [Gammaproteobacteria bacterium]MBT8151441.1 EAL domain-containing protein [Gammaproteobacteria bacterium]NNM12425.1 EAL domain-containing protein [Pseudomonadales bacterium]
MSETNKQVDKDSSPSFSSGGSAVIMMVDDEPIMMELVETYLQEHGYDNFVAVEHSPSAMQKMQECSPDLLLLDLNMPEVSGFEILQSVRETDEFKHLPIIVLTSSTDAESKLSALELGATDFLAKPVDPSELILRLRNILTVKAYQDRLENYDDLTGLPNRKLFLDRLGWVLEKEIAERGGLAVLTAALDRFKQVNDSLGPKVGDQVLKQVAERLVATLRSIQGERGLDDQQAWTNISRLSGDEFAVVLPGVLHASESSQIARRILESFESPCKVAGQEIYLTASIGIAHAPEDGEDSDVLLKAATAATAYAKNDGGNQSRFYAKEINEEARKKLRLEGDLRRAREDNQLALHYQPKINALTGRIVGAEALLRWEHPELGFLPPDQFIPLAEDTGLIIPIGDWILKQACTEAALWREQGLGDIKVSVNVSAKQFRHALLASAILESLASSGLPPDLLVVEITESLVMNDIDAKLLILHELRNLGISLSMDDFGTGYSSLSYLQQLPIDELKIDRSFLVDIPGNTSGLSIVKAVIALAKSLELSTVAEGVERYEQVDTLVELGCNVIQGWYFAKAMPSEQFMEFARSIQNPAQNRAAG